MRAVHKKRPTTTEGLQILPSRTIHYSDTRQRRGYHCTDISAGIFGRGGADPRIVYATANWLRYPDFCGGMMVGCVNADYRAYNAGQLSHVALPDIAPVPDDVALLFKDSDLGTEEIWPVVGVWHQLLACTFRSMGAARWSVFDRVGGGTLRRSLPALELLRGRELLSEPYSVQAGYPSYGAVLDRVVKHKPYNNYNSGAMVQEISLFIRKVDGVDTQVQHTLPAAMPAGDGGLLWPVSIPSAPFPS